MAKPQPEPWKGRIARKREAEQAHEDLLVPPGEEKPKPQTKAQKTAGQEPNWTEKPS